MIIAYHAIFTTYGTWLPNDPRGSFSREVYSEELRMLGETKHGRQSPQPNRCELRSFWATSAPRLSRLPYFIDDGTRPVVADGFAEVVDRLNLNLRACTIMNDHVHILVMRAKYRIEYLVNQLKGAATRTLGLTKTPWTRGCWKVFVNDEPSLLLAARYIEGNPIAAGLGPQKWSFVDPLESFDV